MTRPVRLVLLAALLLVLAPFPAAGQENATFLADIRAGNCDDPPADVVTSLAPAALPSGDVIGAAAGQTAATSFLTVPFSIPAFTGADHIVTITSGDEIAACGAIGGTVNDAGALVIVVPEAGSSDVSGIAYFGPNAADPGQTDVSLFIAGEPAPSANEQPVAPQGSGPTPTPTFEEQVADYVPLADVRELAIRPGGLYGDKIIFSGTIQTIMVASEGRAFALGDDDPQPYEVQMQVQVPAPDGTSEYVFVGYNGDTTGMFEGTWVTIYATVVDTQSFENTLGGGVTQPLVDAEFVLIG